MERVKGIEPSSFGWEPKALPLSYTRGALTGKRATRGRQAARLALGGPELRKSRLDH